MIRKAAYQLSLMTNWYKWIFPTPSQIQIPVIFCPIHLAWNGECENTLPDREMNNSVIVFSIFPIFLAFYLSIHLCIHLSLLLPLIPTSFSLTIQLCFLPAHCSLCPDLLGTIFCVCAACYQHVLYMDRQCFAPFWPAEMIISVIFLLCSVPQFSSP